MALLLDAKKKLQERAGVIKEARSILEKAESEKRDMTAEENAKYDELIAKAGEMRAHADRMERQDALDRELNDTLDAPPSQGTEHRDGVDPKVKERRDKWNAYLVQGTSMAAGEYRALQQDVSTQAGYLIAPEEFVGEVIKGVDDAVYIRQKARKFTLNRAHSMGVPKRTARTSTFAMGTEISAPTADTALAVGKKEFKPNPARGGILVSKTLLRNAPNADGFVREELSYEMGAFQEQKFLTGMGANEPLGVFTASADGISTGRDVSAGNTTTAIMFDGLIAAKYALKPQYWKLAEWTFHRDSMKGISQLKDGSGAYIWRESVRVGEPDRVLNFPVAVSEFAPNTFTTGQYVGLLADWSKYWIVDSLAMELQVLMELYALTNQAYYLIAFEFDGTPVLEEAFVRVKLA